MSGVIQAMDRFAEELQAQGHDVAIVVPGVQSASKESQHVHELFSFPIPGIEGLRIGTPLMAHGPLTISGTLDADVEVIHAHSPFVVGRMGARLAKKRKVPLVFTCHSIYPEYSDYFPVMADLAADVIREYVVDYCSVCDLILAPSPFVRAMLRKWGVKGRIEILPSGVDLESLRQFRQTLSGERPTLRNEAAEKLGIDPDAKFLLFVGRLDHRKNIGFLFQALRQVCGRFDVQLILVGDGPDRQHLQDEARQLGVLDRVHFLGKLPFERVVNWYVISDVFCFSSLSETQGLVLVEAMAAGLPVVALESPTTSWLIEPERTGLLSARSSEAFAHQILRLLNDDVLREEISQQAMSAVDAFSLKNLTKRLISFYELAQERKTRFPRLRRWRILRRIFDT